MKPMETVQNGFATFFADYMDYWKVSHKTEGMRITRFHTLLLMRYQSGCTVVKYRKTRIAV